MSYWIHQYDTTYMSKDDAYEITIGADGTVFVCDYSGEEGGDMDEYEDEEDGLNPNIVKNDFPNIRQVLEYYHVSGSGLPDELFD